MTPRHSSRLTTHLGAIALALAASHAGATTYSVPLQFTLSLTAPVCSLTVGSVTADATTPTPATGVTVDLTPSPLAVIASPNTIASSIPGFTAFTAHAPGLDFYAPYAVSKRMDTPPTASATCTSGTPMTARLTKQSSATNPSPTTAYIAGAAGSGQSGTLPIAMAIGIASFGGVAGVSGPGGVTANSTQPTVSVTATGSAQPLILTAAVYANSATPLTTTYAGLWTYSFGVNLDF